MGTTVVKLGSALVAREDGSVRDDVLARTCDEVAALHGAGEAVVIVTSGAVARGMGVLSLGLRPRTVDELQAASAVGQGKLYQVYDELLRARGVQSAQILLTFFDMSARTHYLNARQTLRRLLDWRVVPVVNENDTTTTDEISFGNNDFLAAQVAILIAADRLVLLTDPDGVHTADPRRDPTARRIARVDDLAELDALDLAAPASALGTGGMGSKVLAAEMARSAGVPTVITSGRATGGLARAVAGEPERGTLGTWFPAHSGRASSFKLWLKYAKPVLGELTVDAGAARALRDGGTSLLPVGITGVSGTFAAGDAVAITHAAQHVGKGIANYSAEELRRVRGLQSAAVRELVPRATEEAIHRDYLVLA